MKRKRDKSILFIVFVTIGLMIFGIYILTEVFIFFNSRSAESTDVSSVHELYKAEVISPVSKYTLQGSNSGIIRVRLKDGQEINVILGNDLIGPQLDKNFPIGREVLFYLVDLPNKDSVGKKDQLGILIAPWAIEQLEDSYAIREAM